MSLILSLLIRYAIMVFSVSFNVLLLMFNSGWINKWERNYSKIRLYWNIMLESWKLSFFFKKNISTANLIVYVGFNFLFGCFR